VVTPVLADQPFWAHRVGVLGVGPREPVAAHQLTADLLAKLLQEATSEWVAGRAREVAAAVAGESGVPAAIQVGHQGGARTTGLELEQGSSRERACKRSCALPAGDRGASPGGAPSAEPRER
jgi:hypothetical protein